MQERELHVQRFLPVQKNIGAGSGGGETIRTLSRLARAGLIPPATNRLHMQSQYTSCRLSCHRCGHAWTYMGVRLEDLHPAGGRPVKVQCPRCKARVAMETKNAV